MIEYTSNPKFASLHESLVQYQVIMRHTRADQSVTLAKDMTLKLNITINGDSVSSSILKDLLSHVNLKKWCDTFKLEPTAHRSTEEASTSSITLKVSDSLRLYTQFEKFNELQEIIINIHIHTDKISLSYKLELIKNSINHILSTQILTSWELELPLIFNHHQRFRIGCNMRYLTPLSEMSGVKMGLERLLLKEEQLRFLLIDLKEMKYKPKHLKKGKIIANLRLFE
ncbi:hypothetical protein WICPIJ_005887 [Wickerhamomyces pijperi]|uniref:Uncharacterized protein n=1 Tax=Wickerhamomyces pijperi TaxID=599730 RepID=A0A9P8Q5F6_WICPI|nr:hypothetical protein WICPIJ_005887 [Wickerhamomyces pijperi]